MWWPLCSKVTPLITSSLPQTGGITLTFFYITRFFFQPPRLTRFLQHLVLGLPSLLFNRWLSNKLCTYSCFHLLHSRCLVSLNRLCCCLLRLRLPRFALPSAPSFPTATHSGSTLAPLLRHFQGVKRQLFECFPLSMITVSSCLKLRVALPNVF